MVQAGKTSLLDLIGKVSRVLGNAQTNIRKMVNDYMGDLAYAG